ncbi:hypothetical protein NO357_05350 [Marimonas arenosa]|uniref:Uncharacterized protein n=2 Tax=Marimonas arenosa TaxID=1795305 RepID=A0AAE3WAU5_9RHOB|nr:hypothetical protein [Marimonas arenosa]
MKTEKVKGGTRLIGQFIVNGEVTVSDDTPPKNDRPKVKIEIPDLFFELKWIAWPGSPSAAFGAAAGYEVVSPDDASYPPPRK